MKERAIVISIDAMTEIDLKELGKRKNISSLLSSSSLVEEIKCVYPTYTYPAHAAIITGCYPDKNGIYHNEIPFSKAEEWFWWKRYLKRKTILDVAAENGLKTSSVAWPTLAGDESSYTIPEIWPTSEIIDKEKMYKEAVSKRAWTIFEKNRYLLLDQSKPFYDLYATQSAIDIIIEYKPDLMLIHLSELDHMKHKIGSYTNLLNSAYDFIDESIGRIISALEESGIYDDTTFFLLGDHGHMDIKRVFAINRLLADMGYITEKDGRILSYRIYAHPSAFSSEIFLNDIGEDEAISVIEEIQTLYPDTIERILTHSGAKERYHLSGPFSLVIEGKNNLMFSPSLSLPVLMERKEADKHSIAFSSHGYTPEKANKPPFVVCGKRAKKNKIIKSAHLVDEGPTILSLFSLSLPGLVDGKPIDGLIDYSER